MSFKISYVFGNMFYLNSYFYINANNEKEALKIANEHIPNHPNYAHEFLRIWVNKA